MSESQAGKGDKRRPAAVPYKTYSDNYETAFKKTPPKVKKNVEEKTKSQ